MNAVFKSVLVVGGGVAGLTVALALARQHIRVHLVEKTAHLGGHAAQFACKATEHCVKCGACMALALIEAVQDEKEVHIRLNTTPVQVDHHDDCRITLADGDHLRADAVVIASGFTPFNPISKPYGYGLLPDVLTNLDLERMLQTRGRVSRPSDGRAPQRLAFIQCVGSRDAQLRHLWCSQVCCASALRMAGLIQHRQPETHITCFYIDIQTFGRDFHTVHHSLQQRLQFIRTIPSDIGPAADGNLALTYFLPGDAQDTCAEFDMVVLSVGLTPAQGNAELAALFSRSLRSDGFFDTADTPRSPHAKGIFVAGTARGPKSIGDSVACAGQTATAVLAYLNEVPR